AQGRAPPQKHPARLSRRSNPIDDSTAKNAARDPLGFNLRSFTDRVGKEELVYKIPEGKLSGYDYNCRPTKLGVPLGRITRLCKPEEERLSSIRSDAWPKEIWGVVGGKGFEQTAKASFGARIFAAGVGRGLL